MTAVLSLSLVLWSVLALFVLLVLVLTFRYIPNDRVGIVEKLWSAGGSVTSGIIPLTGEAGFQPALLRGGWHVLMPFQYRLHKMPLVTIPQGKIAYVFARDGQPLPPTQTLAGNVKANDFQDVAAFLRAGGQRGPQRKILREGTYAFNTGQFVVITNERVHFLPLDPTEADTFKRMAALIADRGGFEPVVIKDAADSIGIVTVHDGPSLPDGLACSGEQYWSLPMNMPTWVISWSWPVSRSRVRARPRSMILIRFCPCLSSVIMRLSGDRSRWMTPVAWTASNPWSAWMPSRTATGTEKGPWRRMRSPTSWPWMCSQTM